MGRAAQRPLLALRRACGLGPVVTARRGRINWRLDLREGIDFAIYSLGAFERGTATALAGQISPGAVVIDVGANIGAHTLPLARRVGPEGRIIAFEPTRFAFDKLQANIARNPGLADRIVTVQAMLVADDEASLPAEIYSSWPLAGDSRSHAKHGGRGMNTEGARVTTLDAYLAQTGTGPVDLIKIDVDGFECDVLNGARHTLETDRPAIITELAPYGLEERGTSVEELLAILHDAGYRLVREDTGARLPDDARALRALVPDGSSMNILVRPK